MCTILTFLTPNLLSAVMSQRQMQKLKCLLERCYLMVIQSVLENRGYVCASVDPGGGGDQKCYIRLTKEGPGFDSSFLLFCPLTFTNLLNPPAHQALKFHFEILTFVRTR